MASTAAIDFQRGSGHLHAASETARMAFGLRANILAFYERPSRPPSGKISSGNRGVIKASGTTVTAIVEFLAYENGRWQIACALRCQ
jgi:hypothetical protein